MSVHGQPRGGLTAKSIRIPVAFSGSPVRAALHLDQTSSRVHLVTGNVAALPADTRHSFRDADKLSGDVNAPTSDMDALTRNVTAPSRNVDALFSNVGGLTDDVDALTFNVGGPHGISKTLILNDLRTKP